MGLVSSIKYYHEPRWNQWENPAKAIPGAEVPCRPGEESFHIRKGTVLVNHQEQQLLVLAHALAYQEHEIQYLKALLIEKTSMNLDEYQQEQEAFWNKSKHVRLHATLQTLRNFQQEVATIRDDIDLDMYMDHLRWPKDPPETAM